MSDQHKLALELYKSWQNSNKWFWTFENYLKWLEEKEEKEKRKKLIYKALISIDNGG
ncbi:MAG: hypothetical protein ACOCV1_07980 [Bacillota bacterium]